MPRIIEIKARTDRASAIRRILLSLQAEEKGQDHQLDTYFVVPNGRLKLRQGNIENTLIHYHRKNEAAAKLSEVQLYFPQDSIRLAEVLKKALSVKVVVDKMREIYFIGNVKFHIDEVKGLGSFVEIEAIDETGERSVETLRQQCEQYIKILEISADDLISHSYSDLLLQKAERPK